jgi:hypothetical protein
VKYESKLYGYRESMRRVGQGNSQNLPAQMRVCGCHDWEEKTERKKVTSYKADGTVNKTDTVSVVAKVVCAVGTKTVADGSSRGAGNERQVLKIVEALEQKSASVNHAAVAQNPKAASGLDSPEPTTEVERLKKQLRQKDALIQQKDAVTEQLNSQVAQLQLEMQRSHELGSPNVDLKGMSQSIRAASGLGIHLDTKTPDVGPAVKKLFTHTADPKTKQYTPRQLEAVVTPFSLAPYQVQARTGFKDVGMLFAYVLLVCDGDVMEMTKRVSNLTWFEEWFLGLEMLHGKSIISESVACSAYCLKRPKTARLIFGVKLAALIRARRRWPMFASKLEDETLRDSKWNEKYGTDVRPVFWDNTGIKLHKCTDPYLQRITFSAYYAGNVAKGGIFVQICGWLGVHELYPGAMTDSKYLNETGILEMQEAFAKADGGVPFTIILDRGYRSTRAAWRQGQFVLQPTFAKSDEKFSTRDVLRAASVAADRSGNERAVRVSKMSAYVKRGTELHKNFVRLSDAWLVWSFQANFMFEHTM